MAYVVLIYDLVPKGVHENRTKGVENKVFLFFVFVLTLVACRPITSLLFFLLSIFSSSFFFFFFFPRCGS